VSHVVQIQSLVKDTAAMRAACQRLGLPQPMHGKTRLFSEEVEGLAVQLPDWTFPIVCDTASGTVRYDNFNGRWGDKRCLERFLQIYSVEKAALEARRQGHQCLESQLPDGSIKLTIQVQGGVL
jgi:hypothetical protein